MHSDGCSQRKQSTSQAACSAERAHQRRSQRRASAAHRVCCREDRRACRQFNQHAISMQSACNQWRTGFAAARTAVRADREQTMPALATCMQGEWMISMQAACNQHAIRMHSVCNQYAINMQSACNHRDRLLLHSFEERLVLSACHLIELVDAAAALSGRTRISMQCQLSGTLS